MTILLLALEVLILRSPPMMIAPSVVAPATILTAAVVVRGLVPEIVPAYQSLAVEVTPVPL